MIHVNVKGQADTFQTEIAFDSGGPVTAVFGPSGCGKTTLIRMICGLHAPENGRIAIGNTVLFDSVAGVNLPAHKRDLGVVFQEARLFPHMNVASNLRYGVWAGGRKGSLSFAAVVELLGLAPLLKRRTANLSGGEKQRVAIGRALLAGPKLLIMDEPLASLDAARKAEILPFLLALKERIGIPMLYVSHALGEIEQIADDMVILNAGRVTAAGPVAELVNRLDVPGLSEGPDAGSLVLGLVVKHDAEWGVTHVAVEGQELLVPLSRAVVQSQVRLHIRAKDVILARQRPVGISLRNVVGATVERLSAPSGPFVEVLCRVGAQFIRARITRLAAADLQLEEGMPLYLLVKSVALDQPLPAGAD
ncbi:molybdenum ABC transporter ATP-binding protein [Pseudovibrio sp. SPO723]|uniref:molybdenum ABC transporter ATP-binding protein n=1 Tax=Nesiotobacter zosterae TaxID=392721 RepID=UPI0029C4B12C|nr:molybdenum ABC transporter ATP-binding protein [Pseudovibrio sp. SPO723]MDX5594835.1 molybdenum ABC transporter ATP-binding protein [Pseudovibrio sp. SPO723]